MVFVDLRPVFILTVGVSKREDSFFISGLMFALDVEKLSNVCIDVDKFGSNPVSCNFSCLTSVIEALCW